MVQPEEGVLPANLSVGTMMLAARTRRVYAGDGQTYSLCIIYYFIVLFTVSRAAAGI
jgi:hypothetical protein